MSVANIFDRFASIMSANINALLDKAEDPAKMIDEYMRQMTEELAEVKEATAGVMAEEKRCKIALDKNKEEIAKYDSLAKKAITAGNEDDARKFIAKKQELEGINTGLETTYNAAHENADKMRKMHDKLVEDINILNGRREMIKAQVAVAKTQNKVSSITGGSKSESAMSAFNRMESKAEEMLNKSEAMIELNSRPSDPTEDLAKKYEAEGMTASVDEELERLKAELNK